jgi:hypothetical protein
MHAAPPPAAPCPACASLIPALAAALARDDLDAALTLGLLDFMPEEHALCASCTKQQAPVLAARDARLRALAARTRYRAREARLAARAEAKAQRRAAHAPALASPEAAMRETITPEAATTISAALPASAAAALARAKARAAAKRGGSSPVS